MTINAETARAIADHAQNEQRFRELVADLVGDLRAIRCAENAAEDMLECKIEDDAKEGYTAINLYYNGNCTWSYRRFLNEPCCNFRKWKLFLDVVKERMEKYGYTVNDCRTFVMISW